MFDVIGCLTGLTVEGVGLLVEGSVGSVAEVLSDGVARNTSDIGLGVGEDNAVLHVVAADLGEGARVRAISGVELSNDGHLLGGVKGEAAAWAVEGGVAHTVRVVIATSLVADDAGSASGVAVARREAERRARVRSVGSWTDRVSQGSCSPHWRVHLLEMLFASQISISEQQAPRSPLPVLALLDDGVQPSMLALPSMNLMSWGHWLSQ
jgi:hypothetical protein